MRNRRPPKPPIQEALPPELRRGASPARCACNHCGPMLSEAQRRAHERVEHDWIATRIAWCEAHGYDLLDLIRADIAAGEATAAERGRVAQGNIA
jgi:hypothetical protein